METDRGQDVREYPALTVRIEPRLYKLLAQRARADRRSMNMTVNHILDKHFRESSQ